MNRKVWWLVRRWLHKRGAFDTFITSFSPPGISISKKKFVQLIPIGKLTKGGRIENVSKEREFLTVDR